MLVPSVPQSVLSSTWLLSAPVASPNPADWTQWGIAGAIIAYVLWRDSQREKRSTEMSQNMEKRLNDLSVELANANLYARDTLATIVRENTTALRQIRCPNMHPHDS